MFQHSTLSRSGFRWTVWLPMLMAMMLAGNSGISQAATMSTLQQINAATVVAPTQTESLTPLAGIGQVVAGNAHTCALTTTGGVKCWGRNWGGELGTGDSVGKATPANVVGLDTGMIAIATGFEHTCALTTAGGVKCWGENSYGQLGDGTTEGSEELGAYKTLPVDVVGYANGVTAIATGSTHTCILTSTGGVKCWGNNGAGQLGDGTTQNRLSPVDVTGLSSGVIAIAAGGGYTCALTTAGGVKCWGLNNRGQLGGGTTQDSFSPVPLDVTGLGNGVTTISLGGDHACALTATGGVKCWGGNTTGQLGDGTAGDGTDKAIPVDVTGLTSGANAISVGIYHTCALTSTGGIKCWGLNVFGQLGDGTAGDGTNKSTPVDVTGLNGSVTAIAAGGYHTCALTTVGGVKCWGSSSDGQLGDDTAGGYGTYKTTPVDVLEKYYEIFLPLLVR